MRHVLIPAVLFAFLLAIPAGAATPETSAQASGHGNLDDRSALHAFIQSRPTPEEFQEAYPEIWLILPGDIVSRDVCSQYYRFIAELDANGRIRGGSLE